MTMGTILGNIGVQYVTRVNGGPTYLGWYKRILGIMSGSLVLGFVILQNCRFIPHPGHRHRDPSEPHPPIPTDRLSIRWTIRWTGRSLSPRDRVRDSAAEARPMGRPRWVAAGRDESVTCISSGARRVPATAGSSGGDSGRLAACLGNAGIVVPGADKTGWEEYDEEDGDACMQVERGMWKQLVAHKRWGPDSGRLQQGASAVSGPRECLQRSAALRQAPAGAAGPGS